MRCREPRKAETIARHCGVSKAAVHDVISRYNRFGVTAIETPGKGGRRRQYLTLEEEQAFLAPFFAQAECGEIWRAFEQHIGTPSMTVRSIDCCIVMAGAS